MIYGTIKNRKIKVGVVGCGRISKNHFDAIEVHKDNLELVGVCDIEPKRLEDVSKTYRVPAFSNLSAMLKQSDADLFVVSTPSGLHPDQTVEIAKAGKHVMCEKPMATRWSDGLRMVAECEKNNVRLFVVKQNRHNATIQLLKNALVQGRFGQLYSVNINVFWQRPQDYYDQAPWRGTRELDGGALMNQASHYVDLVDWLIGPVESVQAYTATLGRKIEMEDTAALSLRWKNGCLGTVNVTMLTFPKNLEGSITVIGEKGTVRLGGLAVNEVQHWEFADKHPDDEKIKEASYQTTSVYGFGHPHYYRNVIETLRGMAEPATCGREGLKSLELMVASYRSADEGRKVSLPLEL